MKFVAGRVHSFRLNPCVDLVFYSRYWAFNDVGQMDIVLFV